MNDQEMIAQVREIRDHSVKSLEAMMIDPSKADALGVIRALKATIDEANALLADLERRPSDT